MSNGTTYFDYNEAKEYANTMKGFGYQVHLGKGKVVGSWIVTVGKQAPDTGRSQKKTAPSIGRQAVRTIAQAPSYVARETVSVPMRTMAAGPKHHPHPFLRRREDFDVTRGKHPRIKGGIPVSPNPPLMQHSIGKQIHQKNIGRLPKPSKDISFVKFTSKDISD